MGNLIYAIPYPQIKDDDLHDPDWLTRDFVFWHGLMSSVGLGLHETEVVGVLRLQYCIRAGVWGYKVVLDGMRDPFDFYFGSVNTNQQWGLFARVTEEPDALVIEVRRDMEWSVLYRRLDPDHTWRDGMFKYRRLRGVWDGVRDKPKGTYKRFSVWIAKEIFAEDPEVDRVRVLLERSQKTLPWEEENLEIERRAERYHKRKNHMPDEPEG